MRLRAPVMFSSWPSSFPLSPLFAGVVCIRDHTLYLLKHLQAEGATAFVLDTSTITIGTVTVDGERARWVQHRRHSVYGSALDIRLPGAEAGTIYAKGQLLKVGAVYTTSSCPCVRFAASRAGSRR